MVWTICNTKPIGKTMTISRRRALKLLGVTAALSLTPTLTLAANDTIICNWNKTFPPYSMEYDGQMTGILVDCMNDLLGKRMGYTVEHRGYAWPVAQDMVRTGNGDTLCTNNTDARKQFMIFSKDPVVESPPSIFCAVDNPRINEINGIQDAFGLKHFRQVDYQGNGWARKTFPPFLNITYAPTLADAFQMIARGKADIFVGNGLAAMYVIKQLGLKNTIHSRELAIGEPSSFHFGLRQDFPKAQQVMDRFEDVLDEAILEKATRKIILHYL